MKRDCIRIFLIVICLLASVMVLPVYAHAPSNLLLTYDPITGELKTTFTHQVDNTVVHYLRKVKVEIEGGPDLLQQEYTSQPTADTFTYTFPIQIAPGTHLRVKGECNIGGEIQQDLIVVAALTVTPAISGTITTQATPVGTTPSPTTIITTSHEVLPTSASGFGSLAGILALGIGIGMIFRKR